MLISSRRARSSQELQQHLFVLILFHSFLSNIFSKPFLFSVASMPLRPRILCSSLLQRAIKCCLRLVLGLSDGSKLEGQCTRRGNMHVLQLCDNCSNHFQTYKFIPCVPFVQSRTNSFFTPKRRHFVNLFIPVHCVGGLDVANGRKRSIALLFREGTANYQHLTVQKQCDYQRQAVPSVLSFHTFFIPLLFIPGGCVPWLS